MANLSTLARTVTNDIGSLNEKTKRDLIIDLKQIIFNINRLKQEKEIEKCLRYTSPISQDLSKVNDFLDERSPTYTRSDFKKKEVRNALNLLETFEKVWLKIQPNERLMEKQPNLKSAEGYRKISVQNLEKIKMFCNEFVKNLTSKTTFKSVEPQKKSWWKF